MCSCWWPVPPVPLGNAPKLRPMVDAGWAVYAPDYRGWGASAPDLPDEAGIHADAWAVWQQLRPRHKRWLIVGHSMGTAVAAQLAARVGEAPELCGVVLESGFPSFARVAAFSSGATVAGAGVGVARRARPHHRRGPGARVV